MKDRFAMAEALVAEARKQVDNIRKEYEASLSAKEVKPALRVAVKNCLENLRSALDFCAHELQQRDGTATTSPIYFPIAKPGAKATDFPSLLEKQMPGVRAKRPDVAALIEKMQAFATPANSWLPDLATLANENKHVGLTAQKRTETERISVKTAGGGEVSWNPAGVRFGSGVYIGGSPVDPRTQMPSPSPTQTVTREIWVGFEFETTGRPVLPFLHEAVAGVEGVIKTLSAT